jgi:hypothetical protein
MLTGILVIMHHFGEILHQFVELGHISWGIVQVVNELLGGLSAFSYRDLKTYERIRVEAVFTPVKGRSEEQDAMSRFIDGIIATERCRSSMKCLSPC